MIVHGVADDVRRFVGPAVIHLVQDPEDTALYRLQSVIHIRNGTVLDHIGGIIQKIPVHHRTEVGIGIIRAADGGNALIFRFPDFGNRLKHRFLFRNRLIIQNFILFVTHILKPQDWS